MDYCASTPLDPRVFKVMEPYLKEEFGNAGSLHTWGQNAIKAVDEARESIVRAIGAKFEEVVFTGSATEANNLALRGVVKMFLNSQADVLFKRTGLRNISQLPQAWTPKGVAGAREKKVLPQERNYSGSEKLFALNNSDRPRIIVSSIEHESILATTKDLERDGVEVAYLPVDEHGVVDLDALKSALNENSILVSIMYVNNVIGTIQPIAEISKIIKEFREQKSLSKKSVSEAERARSSANAEGAKLRGKGRANGWESATPSFRERDLSDSVYPLFHTDAVQAFQCLDCDVKKLGVDMMTLSAHKIGGPKGVGALYTRMKLPAIITGGVGQEFGMRAGTQNVAGVAGFGNAVEYAAQERKKCATHVLELRNLLWREIKRVYRDAQVNGIIPEEAKAGTLAPHILNIFFPAHFAQDLLIALDKQGVGVSAGAACSARASKPSHVLQAIGYSPDRVQCSIRFSLGRETTKEEVQEVIKRLEEIIKR